MFVTVVPSLFYLFLNLTLVGFPSFFKTKPVRLTGIVSYIKKKIYIYNVVLTCIRIKNSFSNAVNVT